MQSNLAHHPFEPPMELTPRYIHRQNDKNEVILQLNESGAVVVNAPRPLPGDDTWEGECLSGIHYASGPIEDYFDAWIKLGAFEVKVVSNEDVLDAVIGASMERGYVDALPAILQRGGQKKLKRLAWSWLAMPFEEVDNETWAKLQREAGYPPF